MEIRELSIRLGMAINRGRDVLMPYHTANDPRPPEIAIDDLIAQFINAALDNYEALKHHEHNNRE